MADTNVPRPTFGPTGFIEPQESAILAGVTQDINEAFGGNLNPDLTTPQGQLASSETAIIGQVNDTFAFYCNQVDPAFAQGRMQDAIARIYFIERNGAQPTVVQAVCVGLAGVVIPVGALALAEDGNLYTCTEAGTIPVSGTITLPFACNTLGPLVCPAHSLNQIYQSIPGWDTIDNPDDGVLGNNTETRAEFEARRAQSVAKNSIGSLPSVLGSVLAVQNVIDAYVTENDTNSPVTKQGYELVPNSLYVAAIGGNVLDIATAIWKKKSPGCAYNGNTSVQVQDSNPGYVPPYPTYTVQFEIPDSLPILFNVILLNNAQVPANAVTLVQNAIIGAFAGTDGGQRARIATELLASRYYAPVALIGAWAQIVSIEIGSENSPDASFTGSITGNTLSVSAVASGTIAIGQTVQNSAGAVLPGTVITAGSSMSWTVSKTQSVVSSPMTGALADGFVVPVNLNQIPTISADNINVTLQ